MVEDKPVGQRISLTANELLYLDDQITLATEGEPEEFIYLRNLGGSQATVWAGEGLLLKLGRGILELWGDKSKSKEYSIFFLEDELWLLRELAVSSVRMGAETVGLNLKMKTYGALCSLGLEGELLEGLPEDDGQEKSTYDKTYSQAFEEVKLGGRDNPDDGSDPDTDEDVANNRAQDIS